MMIPWNANEERDGGLAVDSTFNTTHNLCALYVARLGKRGTYIRSFVVLARW